MISIGHLVAFFAFLIQSWDLQSIWKLRLSQNGWKIRLRCKFRMSIDDRCSLAQMNSDPNFRMQVHDGIDNVVVSSLPSWHFDSNIVDQYWPYKGIVRPGCNTTSGPIHIFIATKLAAQASSFDLRVSQKSRSFEASRRLQPRATRLSMRCCACLRFASRLQNRDCEPRRLQRPTV